MEVYLKMENFLIVYEAHKSDSNNPYIVFLQH